jgi:hypothetical protein
MAGAGFRISAKLHGLQAAIDAALGETAQQVTRGVRLATTGLKDELRGQVVGAGLGDRLAKTWQAEVYPKGKNSLSPAGWVYSKAPEIIDAFDRGATIHPIAGGHYLWLPTENVPRDRGAPRGSSRRAGPLEVELQFNQDLIIRDGKGGNKLAFIKGVRAKNGRGARKATPRRLAQGRSEDLILMFTLVPLVKLPKDLDVQKAADGWGARLPGMIGGS